jgi:chaperonin GroES
VRVLRARRSTGTATTVGAPIGPKLDGGLRPRSPTVFHPYRQGEIVSVSIKPLEDRIVVQPLAAEQTTASGLVIPDTAKEKPQEGKVLAVGPGRVDDSGNRIPVDVQEGDVVIFSKYGGTEVKYNGEEYLVLPARDVLAVVEK